MNSAAAMILAKKHLPTRTEEAQCDSAWICYKDGLKQITNGDELLAKLRFLRSLAYSVGIFHRDYATLSNDIENSAERKFS